MYFIHSNEYAYLWIGSKSETHEREIGLELAKRIVQHNVRTALSIVPVQELSDAPATFYQLFDTLRTKYATPITRVPRIFSLGTFSIEENDSLTQDDLYDNGFGACLVDNGEAVLVWIGRSVADALRRKALKLADDYAKFVKKSAFIVQPGREPIEFTAHFRAWSRIMTRTASRTVTSAMTRKASAKIAVPSGADFVTPVSSVLKAYETQTYSYEELLRSIPEGVDAGKLETYLSEREFFEVFEMTLKEYQKLPTWKQAQLKQAVYLY